MLSGMEPQIGLDDIRRLARDLAARREEAYAEMQGEVELMKEALRRRAVAIAQREQMLAELEHRLTDHGLAAELASLRQRQADADAEQSLAIAERERLDERERQIRAVERELAALRIELEQRAGRFPPASARRKELDAREAELAAREAALDERERALDARAATSGGDTMAMTL